MKSQYIQLPPLPLNMPKETLEMIWLYVHLSKQEQEMIRNFIRENLKEHNKSLSETELAKILQESDSEINPDIQEYADLMRKLLGILIAQSCDMAAFVYQNYCIEGKPPQEIADESGVDVESIRIMAQYYDKMPPLQ
ncbi:hypothetical protein C808_02247 [Lachnospiraceae bacterium M18-1]|nr:hypothetical protein C808_02247 [Lachnospiraceae bacterium M18-1]